MENKNTLNKPRLLDNYENIITPKMMKKFNFTNIHEVCKITHIVLSKGLSRKDDSARAIEDLSNISGQLAIATKAKKSVSQFAVRTGQINGCKVTLRNKKRMYFFLEKICNVYFVSHREFKGVFMKSFNKQKNNISLSIGIQDERLFPEIGASSGKKSGFNLTIVTNAKKNRTCGLFD